MIREDAITTVTIRLRDDLPGESWPQVEGDATDLETLREIALAMRTEEHEVLWTDGKQAWTTRQPAADAAPERHNPFAGFPDPPAGYAAVTSYEHCYALVDLHDGTVTGSLWIAGDWFLVPDDRVRLRELGTRRNARAAALERAERIAYLYDVRDRGESLIERLQEGISGYESWKRRQNSFLAALPWAQDHPDAKDWIARHKGVRFDAFQAWKAKQVAENDPIEATWRRRIDRVQAIMDAANEEREALEAARNG